MPSKYTMTSLPAPRNPAVKLREVAGQRVAVNRFSGFSGEQKVTDKPAQINEWMVRSNQNFFQSRTKYDAPFRPNCTLS